MQNNKQTITDNEGGSGKMVFTRGEEGGRLFFQNPPPESREILIDAYRSFEFELI